MRVCRMGAVIALMLVGNAPAVETACHGERSVCGALVAGERDLASLLVSGDVRIVERLFATDAVWTLASGTRWSKREAVAALRSAPKMASSRLVRADVRQFGGVAVVLWEEAFRAAADAREQRTFGTDTWLRRSGRWQIVASHEGRAAPR